MKKTILVSPKLVLSDLGEKLKDMFNSDKFQIILFCLGLGCGLLIFLFFISLPQGLLNPSNACDTYKNGVWLWQNCFPIVIIMFSSAMFTTYKIIKYF